MLGRAHRFHGYGSLRYVYQHGHNVRGTLMGIRMCENTRRKNYRLAVVVSKKVHKSAVVRNRIRRRLFAIVHQYSDQIKPSMDIVVTVFNDSIATIPAAELEENVVKLLERAELIKQPADKPRHDIIETEET